LRRSERFALALAPGLKLLAQLAHPVAWLLTAASNLVLRPLRDHTNFSESRLSAEEVQLVLEEASRSGTIDVRSADIAVRALDLASLTAQAVAVPRSKVAALDVGATLADAVALALESGHARLPVFGETPDEIEGYVHSRELLAAFVAGKQVPLSALIKQPLLVPWSTRAIDLLQQMQNAHEALALVTDEHGGLAGLVTFEDLVRELVGEIRTSDQQDPPAIQPQGDGTVLLTGSAAIREINRVLGRNLPESPQYTTIAGLCAAMTGHIPQPPEELEIHRDQSRLLIVASSPQRVDAVMLIPDLSLDPESAVTPPPQPAAAAGTGRWRNMSR
jgi:putative hemolysin